jgi:hypothetical protein
MKVAQRTREWITNVNQTAPPTVKALIVLTILGFDPPLGWGVYYLSLGG